MGTKATFKKIGDRLFLEEEVGWGGIFKNNFSQVNWHEE